jgi:hypothetical protein
MYIGDIPPAQTHQGRLYPQDHSLPSVVGSAAVTVGPTLFKRYARYGGDDMGHLLRGSSIKLSNEVIINTCEADWTGVDVNAVVSDASETNYYKRGTRSVYIESVADCVPGILAYGASASAGLSLATIYTHWKYWIYASVAIDGDFYIGMSNAADETGTEYYVTVPDIAAATWTRVITPLSPDMITNLSSMNTIHLYLADDDWVGIVYLDDIRLCRYETSGTAAITIQETVDVENTNAETTWNPEVYLLPYDSQLVTVYEAPCDMTLTGYTGALGAWTSADIQGGRVYLSDGQTAADLNRQWRAVAVALGEDLAAGEQVALEVQG